MIKEKKCPILFKIEKELGGEVVKLAIDYLQEAYGVTFDMTKTNLEMDLGTYPYEKQKELVLNLYKKRLESWS